MRIRSSVLLLGSVFAFAGCSEVVQTPEQTSVIDVVGDPSDPTPNSQVQPDIIGSLTPSSDDPEFLIDSNSVPLDSDSVETVETIVPARDPNASKGLTMDASKPLNAAKLGSNEVK